MQLERAIWTQAEGWCRTHPGAPLAADLVLYFCAPSAIGPYSPAIRAGNLLFISGQVPIDPATGIINTGDIGAQTDQVMRNLSALLAAVHPPRNTMATSARTAVASAR